MNWKLIQLIYIKELREFVRDTRTLMLMIFIPAFLYPGLLLVTAQMRSVQENKLQSQTYTVLVKGDDRQILEKIDNENLTFTKDEEVPSLLSIEFSKNELSEELPKVAISYDSTNSQSLYVLDLVQDELEKINRQLRKENLEKMGLEESFLRPLQIDFIKTNSEKQEGRFLAGKILPGLILIMLTVAAGLMAQEITAGERESGTLETLLCTPAKYAEIVTGKLFTVTTIGFFSGLLNVIFMGITFSNIGYLLAKNTTGTEMVLPDTFLPDFVSIPLILAVLVASALTLSALIVFITSSASTRQEASHYLSPLLVLMLLPVMFSTQPGVESSWQFSLVPGLNFCLIMQDLFLGKYYWDQLCLFFISNFIFLAFFVRMTINLLQSESYWNKGGGISAAFKLKDKQANQQIIPEEGAMIFLTCAALFLLLGTRLQTWNVAWGLPLSQFLIFVFIPLYYLKKTRTKFIDILSLRPGSPKLAIILAFSVPAIIVLAQALKRALTAAGFPSEGDEASQVVVDIVQSNGVINALLIVALTPAICEEFLFRGILLNASKGWKTFSAIALNGLLFGALHMSIANMPALSLMGAYMAYIVWKSGSIFHSVLVHFINNSLAVLLIYYSTEKMISEEKFMAIIEHPLCMGVAFVYLCFAMFSIKNCKRESFDA
ncbi:ABC transporter permease subunit [Lentisphaera marina]|uniref:ABC transporter permease subunit/CPBP intramembrane protease n=1 Tax=Lentisphaera marina TaxID=1111041 RepID=UPI002366BF3C|nr:ABC transporter permease subunit/CPBP intramembrane protease [Lentisphaera marina]MDD7986448.1 ABC transporter permease subunit [Lentisphaera marina]